MCGFVCNFIYDNIFSSASSLIFVRFSSIHNPIYSWHGLACSSAQFFPAFPLRASAMKFRIMSLWMHVIFQESAATCIFVYILHYFRISRCIVYICDMLVMFWCGRCTNIRSVCGLSERSVRHPFYIVFSHPFICTEHLPQMCFWY